jgi:hypothetical protein
MEMNFYSIESEVIKNTISVLEGPPILLQEFSDNTNKELKIIDDIQHLKNKYDETEIVVTSFFEENYKILQEKESYNADKFDIQLRQYYKFLPTLKGKEYKAGIIILDDAICQMLNLNALVNKKNINTNYRGNSDNYRININLLYVAISRFRDFIKIYYPQKHEIIVSPIFDPEKF